MTQSPESAAPPPPAEARPAWWNSDLSFVLLTAALCLGIAWCLARGELAIRAHRAYLEGEKYYSWYQDPAKKKAYFDAELAAQRINPDQYALLMQDNDLKNAYVWYETVLDLYQPPRGEWVLKSEARMKEVKPKYDAWLKSLGVDPVE